MNSHKSTWFAVVAGLFGVVGGPLLEKARAQSAAPAMPKWEVASIRLCEGGAGGGKRGGGGPGAPSPGRLTMNCQPLEALIQTAYARFATGHFTMARIVPIEGAPSWANSERYQINAKAEGEPHQEMMRGPMLQTLLEDRFKLKIHRETREVPVYELTIAKGSPKLQSVKEGGCIPLDFEHPLAPPEPGRPFPHGCGMIGNTKGGIVVYGVTMAEFCKQISGFLDREVIDKTGINGKFDVHLDGELSDLFPRMRPPRPDDPAAASPIDPDAPGIFTAVKQIGLKLGSAKGPGPFLVIDHAEKPTEN